MARSWRLAFATLFVCAGVVFVCDCGLPDVGVIADDGADAAARADESNRNTTPEVDGGDGGEVDATLADAARERAAMPTFTPPGGTFVAPVSVTLQTTTPGATIHFTIDGSTPTTSSPIYGGPVDPFGVCSTQTVRAIAVAPGFDPSEVAIATFVLAIPMGQLAPVSFTPESGPLLACFATPTASRSVQERCATRESPSSCSSQPRSVSLPASLGRISAQPRRTTPWSATTIRVPFTRFAFVVHASHVRRSGDSRVTTSKQGLVRTIVP